MNIETLIPLPQRNRIQRIAAEDASIFQIIMLDELVSEMRRMIPTRGRPIVPLTPEQVVEAEQAVEPEELIEPDEIIRPDEVLLPRETVLPATPSPDPRLAPYASALEDIKDAINELRRISTPAGRIISDKDMAVTETTSVLFSFNKPMIFSLKVLNKGDDAVYVALNSASPGELTQPGETFEATYRVQAIKRAEVRCADDESTTIDYHAQY